MNHEHFHELLALRLYGELAPAEERLLAHHLAECAACRAFERELAGTLGALQPVAAQAAEVPADFAEHVGRALWRERTRRRLRIGLAFAAGLAAGLLAMASTRSIGGSSLPERIARSTTEPPFELRSAPPPLATSRGALAHAGRWLRR